MIAQTLAAGFAVLAAFVLYRLQGIETEFAQAKAVFAQLHEYLTIEEIGRVLLLWPIWKVTVRWLRISLWTTVMDVGWCFVAIPCVPYLVTAPWLAWTSSVIAVIAGLIAIFVYTRVIFLLLAPPRLSPLSE